MYAGCGTVSEVADHLIHDRADRIRGWLRLDQSSLLLGMGAVLRRLGVLWENDDCTMADVTIATHRLTLLLMDWEDAHLGSCAPAHGHVALVTPVPGDQHGFGCAVLGMVLRRAGWGVLADLPGTVDGLAEVATRHPVALAALSIGHERALQPAALLIQAIRRRPAGRKVTIAVGGPMIAMDPACTDRLDADIQVSDAEELARLVEPRRRAC